MKHTNESRTTRRGLLKRVLLSSFLMMIFSSVSLNAQLADLKGSGTEADPYKISTPEDLIRLSNQVNRVTGKFTTGTPADKYQHLTGLYFVMTNDIDMDGVSDFEPIGHNDAYSFRGIFNGQGYEIKNLHMDPKGVATGGGLFGAIDAATLENIGIRNMTSITNNELYVGGLVGEVHNNSTVISNCYVINSTIENKDHNDRDFGGVIGKLFGVATVENCYSINNTIGSNVHLDNPDIGGIVGYADAAYRAKIKNCYTYYNKAYNDNATYQEKHEVASNTIAMGYDTEGNYNVKDLVENKGISEEAIFKTIVANSNGAMVIGEDGKPMTTARAIVTIYKNMTLKVKEWAFLGSLAATADQTEPTTFDFLNTVKPDGAGHHNDFAAVDYNYETNSWEDASDQADYKFKTDEMVKGKGYFVYTFDKSSEKDESDNYYDMTNTTAELDFATTMTESEELDLSTLSIDNTATSKSKEDGGTTEGYWYALSNPFQSVLTFDQIKIAKKQGTVVYCYNSDKGKWYTTETVLPGRGFMVCQDVNGVLEGKLSQKSTAKKSYSQIMQNPEVVFTCIANNNSNTAYARMSSAVSNGFDRYDSYVLLGNNEQIVTPYFVIDGRRILKNEFNSLNTEFDMAFYSMQECDVQLKVSNVPEDMEISVIDLENDNKQTIISDGTAFDFTAKKGENLNRYKILFAKKNEVSINDNATVTADIRLLQENRDIKIYGNDLQSAEVVNMLGQVVYTKKLSGNEGQIVVNGDAGAYIVNVKSNNGQSTQKIIIK